MSVRGSCDTAEEASTAAVNPSRRDARMSLACHISTRESRNPQSGDRVWTRSRRSSRCRAGPSPRRGGTAHKTSPGPPQVVHRLTPGCPQALWTTRLTGPGGTGIPWASRGPQHRPGPCSTGKGVRNRPGRWGFRVAPRRAYAASASARTLGVRGSPQVRGTAHSPRTEQHAEGSHAHLTGPAERPADARRVSRRCPRGLWPGGTSRPGTPPRPATPPRAGPRVRPGAA